MKWKTFLRVCLYSFVLISFNATAENTPSFKQIVYLGDSLSDNGNLYNHTSGLMPKYPPYFEGRFSNGYAWSDIVSYDLFSKYHITSENYAAGGATAVLRNPFDGYFPITLSMERDDYNLRSLLSDKSNTLYVIWIGANDYLSGNEDVDGVTNEVVGAITRTVQSLAPNKGAQFLIVGLPDLSVIPRARSKNLADNYRALSLMHNQKLHTAVMYLRTQFPGKKIMEFSFLDHPILDDIITSKAYRDEINQKYGVDITNVTNACWRGGFTAPTPSTQSIEQNLTTLSATKQLTSTVNIHPLAEQIANSPDLTEAYRVQKLAEDELQPCTTPENYLFWDDVHPTAATHKVIAGVLLDEILNG